MDLSTAICRTARPQGKTYQHIVIEGADRSGVEIVPAVTPALLERVYRLRYEVYCLATGFENPAHQIAGFEQDKYDEHALHSLLIERATGADLGSVRLILPNEEVSLPAYAISTAARAAAGKEFPIDTTAEASRFLRAPESPERGVRHPAFETLALMAAIVKMSAEQNITHTLALVTGPMLRLLNRFGLAFRPLGEPVEFNGLRYAAILDLTTDLTVVAAERPEVWRILTAGGQYYNPHRP